MCDLETVPDLTAIPSVASHHDRFDRSRISAEAIHTNGCALLPSQALGGLDEKIGNPTDETDDEDDPEEDYNDEQDEILQPERVLCFFCDVQPGLPKDILDHCVELHGCDLAAWVKNRSLSTEEIIKMVNYIREEHPSPNLFSDQANGQWHANPISWNSDHYMLPVRAEDHGITSLLIWDWAEPDPLAEAFPLPSGGKSNLSAVLAGGDATRNPEEHRDRDDARNVDYFDSYSGFNIHCEMLRDKVRTESYRKAIAVRAPDKIVLDIGCGSGVLSCFAAAAGAKNVIAVDKADIIDYAHEIARVNNLADKIQFVHGDLDQMKLPVDKVDVIVSEWMGYFLLFEGMLDSVISARDKYLVENGTMIPSSATMYLTAVSDEDDWKGTVGFWNDAYGLKFDCLRQHTLRYPSVHAVDPTSIITAGMILRNFDLLTCRVDDLDFNTEVEFIPTKTCNVTALVGYFDVGCQATADSEECKMFCTSPADTTTHWAQSVFYLDRPFPVLEGVAASLSVDIRKSHDDKRGLTVSFRLKNSGLAEWHQTYQL